LASKVPGSRVKGGKGKKKTKSDTDKGIPMLTIEERENKTKRGGRRGARGITGA